MRTIGICSSSRSERHLMQALVNEMNSGKYDLKAELFDVKQHIEYENRNINILLLSDELGINSYDFLIIPADRSEITKFALECFHRNIPFCHYLAGSQTFSYCHDDTNRWLISLMANFCFAESPQARDNLVNAGQPEDRILVTGTSHFDGITNYDIEANKPKDAPEEPYDITLYNFTTLCGEAPPDIPHINDCVIKIRPNEDVTTDFGKEYSHLEFLWLLKHCDHFISNSSATIYEVPYLNRMGANIKVINPSKRNSERTMIDPMYCKGASAKIAKWCESVDLEWLKTPKRLFADKPSGTTPSQSLLSLPK